MIAFVPGTSAAPAILQPVVPLAMPPAPFAELLHVTLETPTLSDALPASDTVAFVVAKVPEVVGDVIETVGNEVSDEPEFATAGPTWALHAPSTISNVTAPTPLAILLIRIACSS